MLISLYRIKIDITEQLISFIIFFIANLSLSLQLSKIYFIGLFRTLNIILISCIVGQILAVNESHLLQTITCRKVHFL